MAFEDEVKQRLAAKRSEEEADRDHADESSARLGVLVTEIRSELRDAAQLLFEHDLPTIQAWSEKETKSRLFGPQVFRPSGEFLGQCWLLLGDSGQHDPWLLTSNGELLMANYNDFGLATGWCTASRDGWHFELAEDGSFWVIAPHREDIRWGTSIPGSGSFEPHDFLVASVALLLGG